MDTSDLIEFGVGLGLGNVMSRSIGNAFVNAAFTDALDARTSMNALTIPQTRAEIQTLLDTLDVRLANGEISEALYKTLVAKWEKRLAEAS